MTSRHNFPAELRWRAIGRLEADQSQTEVARWLNVFYCLFNKVCIKLHFMHFLFGIHQINLNKNLTPVNGALHLLKIPDISFRNKFQS